MIHASVVVDTVVVSGNDVDDELELLADVVVTVPAVTEYK